MFVLFRYYKPATFLSLFNVFTFNSHLAAAASTNITSSSAAAVTDCSRPSCSVRDTVNFQAVPDPNHVALKGYCLTDSDCVRPKCCISFNTPRGRRDTRTLSPDLMQLVNGKCERRGKRGAGMFFEAYK